MWLPTGGQVENGHIRNNILGTGRRKKERKNILMNVKRNFEQFCSKSLCLSKTRSFWIHRISFCHKNLQLTEFLSETVWNHNRLVEIGSILIGSLSLYLAKFLEIQWIEKYNYKFIKSLFFSFHFFTIIFSGKNCPIQVKLYVTQKEINQTLTIITDYSLKLFSWRRPCLKNDFKSIK